MSTTIRERRAKIKAVYEEHLAIDVDAVTVAADGRGELSSTDGLNNDELLRLGDPAKNKILEEFPVLFLNS